jgi:hypothetical protein
MAQSGSAAPRVIRPARTFWLVAGPGGLTCAPVSLAPRSRAAISSNATVAAQAPSASRIRTHSSTARCAESARDWAEASRRLAMAQVARSAASIATERNLRTNLEAWCEADLKFHVSVVAASHDVVLKGLTRTRLGASAAAAGSMIRRASNRLVINASSRPTSGCQESTLFRRETTRQAE